MKIRGCEVMVVDKASQSCSPQPQERIFGEQSSEAAVRIAARQALERHRNARGHSVYFAVEGLSGALPALAVAKIYGQEIYRYVRDHAASVQEIIFCVADPHHRQAFEAGVTRYLTHVVEGLQQGPFTTVDAIIEVEGHEGEIVVVERSNPPFGLALPGGFVEYGESLESAAAREALEETGLVVTHVRQLHTYSDPSRDPRFHTIGTVFTCRSRGTPKAGDDAAALRFMKLSEVAGHEFAFDHKKIIEDYIEVKNGKDPFASLG